MPTYESWEMRLAWQIAWQARGCPPGRVLRAGEIGGDPRLGEHLAQCPFCSDEAREGPGLEAWRSLATEMREGAVPPASERPSPGQVWTVRSDLAGWGPKNRFYNPPSVLVLETETGVPKAVRVAQVYDDMRLSGPGDIAIGGDFFAEAWNVYTLSEDDLERCVADFQETAARMVADSTVRAAAAELEESSLIMAFRRLEVEVGAFFSSASVARLMAAVEHPASVRLLECFPTPETLIRYLEEAHPGIRVPQTAGDTLSTLAVTRLPEAQLPMAAASEGEWVGFNRVRLVGKGVELEAATASISVWQETPGGLLVGGTLDNAPGTHAELFAWWAGRSGRITHPSESDFDPSEGFFRFRFADLDPEERQGGQLLLLLCEFP